MFTSVGIYTPTAILYIQLSLLSHSQPQEKIKDYNLVTENCKVFLRTKNQIAESCGPTFEHFTFSLLVHLVSSHIQLLMDPFLETCPDAVGFFPLFPILLELQSCFGPLFHCLPP